jgi:hypothetical protein
MNRSESIANLALALAKANADISNPIKNNVNPFFHSKYSDLAEVINCSKATLAEHGLSVIQLLSFNELANVETILLHSTGEWVSKILAMPVPKNDAQTIGATFTYARRYALAGILGLAQQDNDGQTAIIKPANKPKAVLNYAEQLRLSNSLIALSAAWKKIPANLRPEFETLKNELKQSLTDIPNFPSEAV